MKRVLVLLSILGPLVLVQDIVMAATLKLPKSLCLKWGDLEDNTNLIIKLSGSMVTETGKITYYNLNGQHVIPRATPIIVPINGSGHLRGTEFHFSFTGAAAFDAGYGFQTNLLSVVGVWDLLTLTGSVEYHWSLPTDGTQTLTRIDCITRVPIEAGQ